MNMAGWRLKSKRLPVGDVLANLESTSSVPPDFLICDKPESRWLIRASLIARVAR
jgi:hypothetical protein